MRVKISSSEATWQVDEVSAAALPDKRLRLAATIAGSAIGRAGQANLGGLRRLGSGEGGLLLL